MTITVDLIVLGSICGAVLSIAAVVRMIAKPLKNIQQQYVSMSTGLTVLLHFRLTRECLRIQKAGCMTLGQRQDVEDIYDAYHALGGNGSGSQMFQKTMGFPVCEGTACEIKDYEE